MKKKKVFLVSYGVNTSRLESYPLACSYLKVYSEKDEEIRKSVEINIYNYTSRASTNQIIHKLLTGELPDIIAFSVYGWNYYKFIAIAETYKQLKPDGIVIMGGPHVSNQGYRVLANYPWIDLIINGEGEITFHRILKSFINGELWSGLALIDGISYRNGDKIVHNKDRELIADINEIPSPYLNEVIQLFDENNKMKFDVALMETSRGCPYKCSFCNWNSGIGGKVKHFNIDRLCAELEYFANNKVEGIVLCDSNFGLFKEDVAFIENLVRIKQKTGYPKYFETSWTKLKTENFFEITRLLKENDLMSSITIALQTLNKQAMSKINRNNVEIDNCEIVINSLRDRGFTCYGELIWGLPGETYESFIEGYDKLSNLVSRIAVYPLLILPNTELSIKKEHFGIITIRDIENDFEYLYSHNTISLEDNVRMQRFIFWVRILVENMMLLKFIKSLNRLYGIKPSELIISFMEWLKTRDDEFADVLNTFENESFGNLNNTYIMKAVNFIYNNFADFTIKVFCWWKESYLNFIDKRFEQFTSELLKYTIYTRPIFNLSNANGRVFKHDKNNGTYILRNVNFKYNIPDLLKKFTNDGWDVKYIIQEEIKCDIHYKGDFNFYYENQEFITNFEGVARNIVLKKDYQLIPIPS